MTFTRCFRLYIALLLSLTAWAAPDVELLVDGDELLPSTTLEIRFAREMVNRDQLSIALEQSPLVFQPALVGKFTWLSQRSGVFVPSEAPRMGTFFAITLRVELKDAAGKAIGGKWRATLRTPPFEISVLNSGASPLDLSPQPEVRIAFNRDVKIERVEKLFRFIGDTGKSVAATVRHALPKDHFSIEADAGDWDMRWKLAHDPAAKADEESDQDADDEKQEPQRNRLIVTPVGLLTPGGGWRLEMKPGIEAASGGYLIKESRAVELGRVQPFALKSLITSSYLNSGRSALIEFSTRFGEDVDDDTAAKFFRVTPEVKNLRFETDSPSLTLRGDFERGTEYRIEFDPALISDAGLPLSGERSRVFRFDPVKPRIYLPEISGHQIAGGRRKFPALSVNLRSLRVNAQLIAPEKVGAAVEAFAKYNKDYDEKAPDEKFQPLPPGLIAGKIIAEKTIAIPSDDVDARQETALDWDEIAGGEKTGAIFLTVEGQPVAEAAQKRPAAQALIQLTDLGVLWKKLAGSLRVTVFSMRAGQPLADAEVALLDEKFAQISKGKTDADGTTLLPPGANPAWLVVRSGADAHTLSLEYGKELPMAAFNVPVLYDDWRNRERPAEPLNAFIFTDRPLYRPGESIHVKGIVRIDAEAGPKVAAGFKGQLTLSAPHERGETTINVTTDERGAFDAQMQLDPSTTGNYGVSFFVGDHQKCSASFAAGEVQPNAFELNVAAPGRFAPGAEVAAEVSGKYFFGAPLAGASARWTLEYRTGYFSPPGFKWFTFGSSEWPDQKTLILNGEGALPNAGTLSIRPKLPEPKERPMRGVFTVAVTDANQQTITETREFQRDAADFYLGLKGFEQNTIGHGEEFVAYAVAVKTDGEPMPAPVPVKAELVRVRYETVRVQGAGGAVNFHSDKIEEVVATGQGRTLVPVSVLGEWMRPEGETVRFKPQKAGSYVLRLSAVDAKGRPTVVSAAFNVSGNDPISWDYRNPSQVDLVPDKAEYRIGEKARVLVKTPISGEALVTVERGSRILREQRVRLEGNAPTFDIPIEAGDGPNVFVSLMLLRGSGQSTRKYPAPEFRYGVCRLNIGDPASRLTVGVAPKSETVQPGEEVAAEVSVRDGNGAAVADAEVTFFAVDEGVLALTGYERPQPQQTFHRPIPLGVRTGLSLYELMPEDPADLEFSNKGYLIGGGGLAGPGPKLRTDFPGTAVWLPSLRTDRDGKVTARFPAPDALTRYRLVAVAHAGANAFGSGESAFSIRKKLMILSALGQIANVGDTIVARAVVRNETGASGTAEVALVLDATAEPAQGALTAKLDLKSGESRAVDFPVKLRATGDAGWKWTARIEADGKVFEDAMLASLKVGSPALVLRETYLTDLSAPTNDLLDGVNPQLLEGDGALRVTLSNTRLASLRETASALLEYPYGCAEQTVSALIPWITMNELGPVLPDLAKSKDDVRKAIRAGVDKIFALQTPEGGIAYWPGGKEPEPFPSAYAAVALSLLEKQGVELDPGWPRLLKFLSQQIRGLDGKNARLYLGDITLMVFALANAGKAEPAYHELLYARRAELSHESRALLASAIMAAGGPANLTATLLDPRTPAPENFSWFGGASRERAVRLMAWTRFKPADREVDRLVKELLAARANGKWRTTQENAWAMLALSRYFTTIEREVKPVDGALVKAGIEAPFALTKTDLTKTVRFAFDPARPLGELVANNPKKAALYGETNFVVRPPVAAQPRQDRGYAVSRSYEKIAGDNSLQPAADLQVGDRVLVTLRIETKLPGHFVAIDDPLPAILEAVNPEFRTQGADARETDRADYREIRADRVLYFCDHLPAGAFNFRYLARVRTAGKVTAPSVKVEEMYRPERFGLSESAQLTSRAAE